jgi:hypothetical protein
MTKTAKNKLKVEIKKTDSGDYDFHAKGGELTDYLAILSGVFVQLCKDNKLPVVPLIKANFHELVNPVSDSIDKLEEYLIAYDEESIQKIRDEKMQLVTADEFVGLHQEKLAAERKSFKPQPIYSIPSDIAKILDETDVIEADIPQEVWDWVDETKDDYLDWMGRTFLVLAYCNPLTSPKAFPNIWKVE